VQSAPEPATSAGIREGGPPSEETTTPAGPSGGVLLGYGFTDGLNFGFGARGGYTMPNRVYLGGLFMYHLGSSRSTAVNGVSVSSHESVFYGGFEGGYDFNVGRVMIRPYGGIGPAWASTSEQASGPTPGTSASVNVASTSGRFACWLGGMVLYPLDEHFALGGDARVLFVSDYNSLNLLATGTYRF
jgi:hypothetical protein